MQSALVSFRCELIMPQIFAAAERCKLFFLHLPFFLLLCLSFPCVVNFLCRFLWILPILPASETRRFHPPIFFVVCLLISLF